MKEDQMLCPRVDCKNHVENGPGHTNWFNKHGGYWNKRLKRRVQRFRCKDCGKTFSVQTFSVDYWIKITVDYRELEVLNATVETISEMARMKNVSYSVIRNRFERLCRQYIAYDSRHLRLLG